MTKPHVLFLCTHNAARSQMAETILRRHAGDRFDASSAGLTPTNVHPHTRIVLAEIGVETASLRAKPIQEFLGKSKIDCAVFVCDRAEAACPRVYPFALHALSWPFDDPVRPEESAEINLARFRRVRDQIDLRVRQWLTQPTLPGRAG